METQRIPVGQISYSSIRGVSLFNGIAHYKFVLNLHNLDSVHYVIIGLYICVQHDRPRYAANGRVYLPSPKRAGVMFDSQFTLLKNLICNLIARWDTWLAPLISGLLVIECIIITMGL